MRITGGVAGNVVPDECVVTVNFRFAPDRDVDGRRAARARGVRRAATSTVTDSAPGALPGLRRRGGAEFVAADGRRRRAAKFGWTDVARFAALGIPAVNYGPGDPNLAHTREEHVDVRAHRRTRSRVLRRS